MTIIFSKISSIFYDFINDPNKGKVYDDEIENFVYLIIKTNKVLWDLEDSARLSELGDKHVADAKRSIDIRNQERNNLIREIDVALHKHLNVTRGSSDVFYSESPGMIIDRLSIIFIKLSVVKKISLLIKEDGLRLEYLDKRKVLEGQISSIGSFLDLYINRLVKGDVFFEIQQAVKIYNDTRVREYIKSLDH